MRRWKIDARCKEKFLKYWKTFAKFTFAVNFDLSNFKTIWSVFNKIFFYLFIFWFCLKSTTLSWVLTESFEKVQITVYHKKMINIWKAQSLIRNKTFLSGTTVIFWECKNVDLSFFHDLCKFVFGISWGK